MIMNPKKVAEQKLVHPCYDKQIQQNGIDLTVTSVSRIKGEGKVWRDGGKQLPKYIELPNEGIWKLNKSDAYLLQIAETITVPKDKVALVWMRSTFNRCGCLILGCVFDSGYKGKPTLTMYPHCDLFLERFARVAQILFFEADSDSLYDGQYQNEGEGGIKNEFKKI